jgi:hypothetical protein
VTNKHDLPEKILAHGKNIIYVFLEYLQYFVALTIIVAIGITLLSIPQQLGLLTDMGSESLVEFLEYIINVIISIELIHVLLHQTLDSIVEVLSLAITRELILQHLHTYEFLIGVFAVAALFAIRKFLFVSKKDSPHSAHEDHAVTIDEDGIKPAHSPAMAAEAPAAETPEPTEPAADPAHPAPSSNASAADSAASSSASELAADLSRGAEDIIIEAAEQVVSKTE